MKMKRRMLKKISIITLILILILNFIGNINANDNK